MAQAPLTNQIRLGVAGWSLPLALRSAQAAPQSVLEHYATLFNTVEINSSFYRPHRLATYQRWSLAVPESFRFAVKVPKLITHERRLVGCRNEIYAFLTAVFGLGDRLGALLVQLPPSFRFDAAVARDFFRAMRELTSVPIVCEARHVSWFDSAVAALFEDYQVARVWAHPAPPGCNVGAGGAEPGRFSYRRLHGSPRVYYSSYDAQYLQEVATILASAPAAPRPAQSDDERWCIFDNTASGAAWSDAQLLQRLLRAASVAAPDCGAQLALSVQP